MGTLCIHGTLCSTCTCSLSDPIAASATFALASFT
jgi:hypothetical protein